MRSALIAVLVAGLLAPAVAAGQSQPFAPLPQAPPTAPAPVPGAPGAPEDGISGGQQALLIFAGIAVVIGIGVAIARDARRNAPGADRPAPGRVSTPTVEGAGERKKPDPRAAQKQKAAAKRARQARKKNRPVRK